ncbi:hypothetical protein [Pikeienuella sp. HZG-20]|uniref:hypothetical protein n=1 Tax=Paludibacillus litoralis TaxID=3133267 RepID=UPI0030EBEB08
MRPHLLLRLCLALLIGLATGPRPALAAGGEVICGLGLATYDFELGAPRPGAPAPGLVACDDCLAAAPLILAAPALQPAPRIRIRAAPAPALPRAAPRRAALTAHHPRAPPAKAMS